MKNRYTESINLIASVFGVTAAVAATFAWLSGDPLRVTVAALCVAFYLTGTTTALVLKRKKSRDYELENLELTLRVENPKKYLYTSSYSLKVLRAGLTNHEHRLNWSGKSGFDVRATSNHFVMGPPILSGRFFFFYIFFGRQLGKGEKVNVGYEVKATTKDPRMVSPSMSRSVRSPITGHLSFRAELPLNVDTSEIVCEERKLSSTEINPVRKPEVHIGADHKTAYWRIENPKTGHEYSLKWKWPKGWGN